MADKVRPGQEIEAKQLNAVIDAISINQPNAVQPFRTTTSGGLVNGGHTYITKAPSKFENLFNVSYGPGILDPDIYTLQTKSWTGIWAQIADWEQLELMLYHGTFFPSPVSLFVIDPTAQAGKLIWVLGSTLISKIGKLPICESTHSAGIAVFQVFNSSSTGGQDAYNGSCCIVIGDFTKFGNDQGWRPDFGGQNSFDDYLDAIKACDTSGAFFGNKDEIALRFTSPLYVQKSDLEDQQLTRPVTYAVGQQHIESIPDSNNSAASIGKDVYLSSIEFTPATQFNTYNQTPTWSYSLYNFHKKDPDIDNIDSLPVSALADYDILLKHKFDHPSITPVTQGNCKAVLEYLPLSCLIGDVDSNISALHLSSIQDGVYTDPDTGKDTKYHELFNFDQRELADFQISDDCDIVLRDYTRTRVPVGAAINYVKLSDFLSAISAVNVDTWSTQGAQRSIDWNTQNGRYLQLYNFDSNGYDDALRVNLAYGQHRYATKDGSGEYPDPYVEFVVRDRSGNRMVKYDALDIYAPPISASDITDLCSVISSIAQHECSCDLGPLSAKVDQLSSQLSNYWKVGGTYNDNCYGESIGDSSSNPQIHLDWGQLFNSNDQDPTVDWHNGYLQWNNAELRLDWGDCITYDKSQGQAIDWDYRHLYDAAGNVAVRWNNRMLHDSNQSGALDWDHRTLYDSNNNIVADWDRSQLLDSNTTPTVDWGTRRLYDSNQNVTLDWQQKTLEGNWTVNGNLVVQQGATLTIGNTTITEAQLQALLALINVVPQALQGI